MLPINPIYFNIRSLVRMFLFSGELCVEKNVNTIDLLKKFHYTIYKEMRYEKNILWPYVVIAHCNGGL